MKNKRLYAVLAIVASRIEAVTNKMTEVKDEMTIHELFNYSGIPNSGRRDYNLLNCDKDYLIGIAGFLIKKHEEFKKGCKMLGIVPDNPFEWQGHSVNDWITNIKLGITYNTLSDEFNKLEDHHTALSYYKTNEDLREEELEKVEEHFNSDPHDQPDEPTE